MGDVGRELVWRVSVLFLFGICAFGAVMWPPKGAVGTFYGCLLISAVMGLGLWAIFSQGK